MGERPEGIWGDLGEVGTGPSRTSSDVGAGLGQSQGQQARHSKCSWGIRCSVLAELKE